MIVIVPTIIGNIRNWNDTPPIITTITVPPAGGCVILNAIMSIAAIPTAKPIVIKETSKKVANIIPTKADSRWPKNTFFGLEFSLLGNPKTLITEEPKEATYQRP